MDFFQCIEDRKSCRAFLRKEVDKAIVEKILKAANRSPSFRNSQPWEVFVVGGEKKEALAKRLLHAVTSGTTYATPALPVPHEWPKAVAQRMKDHNLLRLKAVGIDPKNEQQIHENQLRNYKFYDAPCVVFVGRDKALTDWSLFDLGSFVHGLLLGLEAEGLGGCPQASVTHYPDIIRDEVGIPETVDLIIGISLGYPDPDAAVNRYRSKRRGINDFVRWYGFS